MQSGWRMRLAMVVVAGALPVGYQIFRMGYYAVLVPNPAIAKDASGAKWDQGFAYLTNLFTPYTLLLPVIVAIVAGLLLAVLSLTNRPAASTAETADGYGGVLEREKPSPARRVTGAWGWIVDRLQSQGGVVTVVAVSGLILGLYWLRQGGDFMHGRVLLSPIFVLLLPVMVIPVGIPTTLPEFRARCLGIPAFARAKLEVQQPGEQRSPFTRFVWGNIDGYAYRQADGREALRMLQAAYDLAVEARMQGAPLPEPVAGLPSVGSSLAPSVMPST